MLMNFQSAVRLPASDRLRPMLLTKTPDSGDCQGGALALTVDSGSLLADAAIRLRREVERMPGSEAPRLQQPLVCFPASRYHPAT